MNFSFNVSRHLHHWLTDRICDSLWRGFQDFLEFWCLNWGSAEFSLPFLFKELFLSKLYNSFMLERLVHTSPPIFWLHFIKSHLEHRVIPVNELLLNDSTDTALSKYLACYYCLLQLLLDNIITTFLELVYILTRKI